MAQPPWIQLSQNQKKTKKEKEKEKKKGAESAWRL